MYGEKKNKFRSLKLGNWFDNYGNLKPFLKIFLKQWLTEKMLCWLEWRVKTKNCSFKVGFTVLFF